MRTRDAFPFMNRQLGATSFGWIHTPTVKAPPAPVAWPPENLTSFSVLASYVAGVTPLYTDAGKTTEAGEGDSVHTLVSHGEEAAYDLVHYAGTQFTLEKDANDEWVLNCPNSSAWPEYRSVGNGPNYTDDDSIWIFVVKMHLDSEPNASGGITFFGQTQQSGSRYDVYLGFTDNWGITGKWRLASCYEHPGTWPDDFRILVGSFGRYMEGRLADGHWELGRGGNPGQDVDPTNQIRLGGNGLYSTKIEVKAAICVDHGGEGIYSETDTAKADLQKIFDALIAIFPTLTVKNPPNVSYPTLGVVDTSEQAIYLAPSNIGAAATSWSDVDSIGSVAGVTFNTTTGVITFDPSAMAPQASTSYTIRATAADGSYDEVEVVLEVVNTGATTKRILYPTTLQTLEVGVPITPIDPTFSGTGYAPAGLDNTFSVTPDLPSGLGIGADGRVYGSPSEVAAEAVYTVTDDTDGSAWGSIRIAVEDAAAPASAQMGEG